MNALRSKQDLEGRLRVSGDPLPWPARLFIGAIIAAGAVVLFQALRETLGSGDFRWLYLATFTSLTTFFSVRIPIVRNGGQSVAFAMGDIFVFTAMLLFGPAPAVCVVAVESLALSVKTGLRQVYKYLFNLAHLALACYLVSLAFYWMIGADPPLDPFQALDPLAVMLIAGLCGLIYFALNTGMVAVAVALTSPVTLSSFWKDFGWASISHFSCASMGALIFLFFGPSDLYFLGIALPMIPLLYYTFRVNQHRVQQTQKHLDEVSALLAEKIEAEKELQRSKDLLETRVEQRTSELREANRQLRIEVSDRRAAQEALAGETERLSVTLRSIGEGVITADTLGRVVLMNEVAEKMTGWPSAKAVGQPLSDVFCLMKEDRRNTRDLCGRVLESGEIISLDLEDRFLVSRHAGKERSVTCSAAPIRDPEGAISGVVIVFRDVTEKQRMEQELLKAQQLESLGILAGGIAHDFNNILSGILLKTQLAQRSLIKERNPAKYLESIHDAVQTATTLTQQLLTFAKGGAPIKQTASIGELLEDTARFALRGSTVRCEIEIPVDLWSADLDKGQISQVIHNLVLNAAQAMPTGGTVSVTAENREIEADEVLGELSAGTYVMVSVRDEGVGIRAEDLLNIFDPYFSTKPTGHGLGLTTTHSIIQKHNGHIEVESEPGEGSVFRFYLPASPSALPQAAAHAPMAVDGSGRVLLMDDEKEIRESLGEVLNELGYEVGYAADGAEALAAYTEARRKGCGFDAVIMDLTIPGGMGGKETVEKLLRIDPEAVAIVSSGYSKDPVMAAYRAHGFQATLPKPFELEKVSLELSRLLRKTPPGKTSNLRLAG